MSAGGDTERPCLDVAECFGAGEVDWSRFLWALVSRFLSGFLLVLLSESKSSAFLDLWDFFLSLFSDRFDLTKASTATGTFTGPVGQVAGAKNGVSEIKC